MVCRFRDDDEVDNDRVERGAGQPTVVHGGGRACPGDGRAALPWWSLILACVGWLGLWYFTPGLHSNGIGYLFTDDDDRSLLVETMLALLLAVVLVLLYAPGIRGPDLVGGLRLPRRRCPAPRRDPRGMFWGALTLDSWWRGCATARFVPKGVLGEQPDCEEEVACVTT